MIVTKEHIFTTKQDKEAPAMATSMNVVWLGETVNTFETLTPILCYQARSPDHHAALQLPGLTRNRQMETTVAQSNRQLNKNRVTV